MGITLMLVFNPTAYLILNQFLNVTPTLYPTRRERAYNLVPDQRFCALAAYTGKNDFPSFWFPLPPFP